MVRTRRIAELVTKTLKRSYDFVGRRWWLGLKNAALGGRRRFRRGFGEEGVVSPLFVSSYLLVRG